MTSGPLVRNILLFSIPLAASNLLQVLFNMSDVAVVGRFAGAEALGSVGSCTTAVTLFTGLLIGMGAAVNALTARFIGAQDREKTLKCIHTSFMISLVYGFVIMTLGLCIIKGVLELMGTREELLPGAVTYMMIYLTGTPAMAVYNFGNGVLSASGDTKRPLNYLTIAGILNIILNLFFVIVMHMDAAGVALASSISQYVSAGLILWRLITDDDPMVHLHRDELHIDRKLAKSILTLGISAGLQNSIFAIANLFIQAAVNSFDTLTVEGNSAAANADALVYDVMAAFYAAGTTFIAQNYGAGNKKRIKDSYLISMGYAFFIALIIGTFLFFFGNVFLGLFTTDAAVKAMGMKRLRIMAFSYCVSAFMDASIAASRGLGKTVVPAIAAVVGSCLFRILWIYTIFAHYHTIPSLYLLYVFSWSITACFEIIYFIRVYKSITAK